jgi:sterol desaturase/sphingolipid hydroxylase (fatty acid hydroxylase superfamily)
MHTLSPESLSPYALAIPFGLIAVGLETAFDHDSKTNPLQNLNESIANLMIGMTDLSTRAVSQVAVLYLYILVYDHWRIFTLPEEAWMILIGILVYEFFYYWKHRMGHELNLMWAGHIVHHQSRVMNFTASVRNSSTSGFWSIPFFLWMAWLGFSPWIFLKAQIISHLWQFFLHTERVGKLHPWFEFIFNTPSHHRVHHGREEKYLDKNYGSVFILLDRLFGTFQEEEGLPSYGTTDGISPRGPIQANLRYYRTIARAAVRVKSPVELWQLLFGRPADVPFLLSDRGRPASEFPVKHRTGAKGIKSSILLQFAMTALGVFLFLSAVQSLPGWLIALNIGWLVGAMSATAAVMENPGRRTLIAQATILASLPVLIWLHFTLYTLPWLWIIPACAFCMNGLVLLRRLKKKALPAS